MFAISYLKESWKEKIGWLNGSQSGNLTALPRHGRSHGGVWSGQGEELSKIRTILYH